ncbi:MAG: hypothetical protein H8E79_01790 [Desulfobulbaceae bacterium]|uniref:Uncharacterized protein n=1 Tax=Candidatus Desulfatifera sulfidica TaxID=2841691 RepID=A0A8J6N789_9BACT|nr:hypothetical protein [Candidatus Desulfatifera sulfidica]
MDYKPFLAAACLLPILFGYGTSDASAPVPATSNTIQWQAERHWTTPAPPLDIVHSLDNKKVFILAADNQVHIYEGNGRLLGSIPVDKGVVAIDIEPRGNKLYLINEKDNSFTSLNVDYVSAINTTGSPFMGPADAPVTIAVFTDFE